MNKRAKFAFLFLFQISFLSSLVSEDKNSYFSATRYYDPKVGRLISSDTQTPGDFYNLLGLNRCAYAFNNPLKYNDPDGHHPQDPSDEETGTIKHIKDSIQAVRELVSSDLAYADIAFYGFNVWKNHITYKRHLSRKVTTGVAVIDSEDVPDSGPKVAHALQQIAGKQAKIGTVETYSEDGSKSWLITYQQDLDHLNDGSDSSKAWSHLKRSLESSRLSSENYIGIYLFPLRSREAQNLINRNATGITIPTEDRRVVQISVISDIDKRKKYMSNRLPVDLAHELKHAENMIQGKPANHLSFFGYIFRDDPVYPVDNIYTRAYNENNPQDQLPPVPPKPVQLGGLLARETVFKTTLGVDPTKLKKQE